MKNLLMAASGLALLSGTAIAGGLDRTGQPIGIIFEEGTYAEFSFSHTRPSVSGNGLQTVTPVFPDGFEYGDVAKNFSNFGAGFKTDLNDKLSLSFIFEQPFGADILYGGDPATTELGGTSAVANTESYTAVLRYKFDENFSVHAGVRAQQAGGQIDLRGTAYGPFGNPAGANGYSVDLGNDFGFGYLVGVAYERPDIALRVALTYNSAITHEFETNETFLGTAIGPQSITETDSPESLNLDFQTGVAKDTLVFGNIRYAKWSEFKIVPEVFGGSTPTGLVDLDDSTSYTLGVGRRFTDNWAGSVSYTYEEAQDPLVSPLAPTDGLRAITVAAIYTLDKVEFTTGIRYTQPGDATPEVGTPDTARANFTDNEAVTVGFKVGYNF
ncbi:OmpP1/FadL family transporter [Actibacterium sp. 188UL27-1]|uniref:OmpP1/FadL family transporter n=1 Tax=Actibacterium sp. 188UL27-1 TaxID=2786961 RepID=UPI001957088D|nr:outer membrane protein transport protein [Actibacterium sp. 188UL27-1]MBM7068479.1 outer membrane protein transport protein [Actibacterium sp. 188UL27-1]